jgi:MFS family permease
LIYLLFVRQPSQAPGPLSNTPAAGPAIKPAQVLRNRDIWLLAATFAAFNAAVIGLATYMPTFLTTERGLALGPAALLSSVSTLITIFSAPAGGILSDRIGSRKTPYLVGLALSVILLPLTGALSVGWLIVLVVITGLVIGMIPTTIFAAAVEQAGDQRLGGMAMAVIMVGQNGGMLLGPLVFGALAEGSGWPAAFASLAVMSALGLLAGWLARVR